MSERERLAKLSPDRLRLLEELRRRELEAQAQVESTPASPPPVPDDAVLREARFGAGDEIDKERYREFYDRVSRQLDDGPLREHALFLNFGYVANDNPTHARVRLPPNRPSRNPIRLVLELVGDAPLGPEDRVLDVGCGRGGTIAVLREFFAVGPIVGLDLSSVAIASNRDRLGDARTQFVVGDAEALPFADGSFDVVTNVESSHSYPECEAFYAEVARVLRAGGVFLYTDMLARASLDEREAKLAALGFVCERREDITANVLLSCDATASTNVRAFSVENDRSLLERFLGAPDSEFYRAMKRGEQRYMLYRFRLRGR